MSDVEVERGSHSDRELAVKLLAAARANDLPASVVRKTTNGFLVPEVVAESASSGKVKVNESEQDVEKPAAKKAAAKKSTTKKKTTAAKTAAATKE